VSPLVKNKIKNKNHLLLVTTQLPATPSIMSLRGALVLSRSSLGLTWDCSPHWRTAQVSAGRAKARLATTWLSS